MIVLAARPCWANSSRLRRKSCFSSCPCTHVSPHTSGGMTRAIATRSSKPKRSSEAILLRRRYSRLASTMRSQPRCDRWRQENSWQPFWMTFMSPRRRHEPVACWTPPPTPSSFWLKSFFSRSGCFWVGLLLLPHGTCVPDT